MASARTSAGATTKSGDDAFLVPASIRQPAEGLGPRAQRTIDMILEATSQVFMARGYAGTTVDEIARVAGISRASFYTYFPTKRDVLLASGASFAADLNALAKQLAKLASSRGALVEWVSAYFEVLDRHGAFALAWPQAAREDAEIRTAGAKRQNKLAKELGKGLAATAGKTVENPAVLGLVSMALLERCWLEAQTSSGATGRSAIIGQVAQTLWATARQSTATATGAI